MKVESLVIADEDAAVNTYPIFVHTARHVTEIGGIRRNVWYNCFPYLDFFFKVLWFYSSDNMIDNWDEVVTR